MKSYDHHIDAEKLDHPFYGKEKKLKKVEIEEPTSK